MSLSAKIAGSTGHYHASTAWSYFRPLATSNLLEWWKIHYIQYLKVFSASGHIVSKRRTCLKLER